MIIQRFELGVIGFNQPVFFFPNSFSNRIYFGLSPLPVRVTTRTITFLVGNPYKPSFATATGWGVDPRYTRVSMEVAGSKDC